MNAMTERRIMTVTVVLELSPSVEFRDEAAAPQFGYGKHADLLAIAKPRV